jgi:hypothetical protein
MPIINYREYLDSTNANASSAASPSTTPPETTNQSPGFFDSISNALNQAKQNIFGPPNPPTPTPTPAPNTTSTSSPTPVPTPTSSPNQAKGSCLCFSPLTWIIIGSIVIIIFLILLTLALTPKHCPIGPTVGGTSGVFNSVSTRLFL